MNTRHPVQQGGTAAGGSIVCCPSPQAPLSARQRCARPQGWAHRWGGSSTAWPWASQQHPLWAFSFQGRGLFLLSESAHSVLSGKSCWEAARQSAATHKALRLHPWVPQLGQGKGLPKVPKAKGGKGASTVGDENCWEGDANIGWEGRGTPTRVGKKRMPTAGKGHQDVPKAKGGNGTRMAGVPTLVGKRWMPSRPPAPGDSRDARELSSADVRSVSLFCSMYDGYIMTHIHDIPSLRKTAKNGPCVK